MQRLEVSCAVRRVYTSLGAKGLISHIVSAADEDDVWASVTFVHCYVSDSSTCTYVMFVSFSSQSHLWVFPPFVVCKCVFHSGTVQFVPVAHHEGVWASSGITPHVLNPWLNGGELSAPSPHLTALCPVKATPVVIEKEAGSAPEPVCTVSSM